jgi:hypothetical protein
VRLRYRRRSSTERARLEPQTTSTYIVCAGRHARVRPINRAGETPLGREVSLREGGYHSCRSRHI